MTTATKLELLRAPDGPGVLYLRYRVRSAV
jgi:hypothetical protein